MKTNNAHTRSINRNKFLSDLLTSQKIYMIMSDISDKLASFQSITGLKDTDLCRETLSAHGWDLQQAISSLTSTSSSTSRGIVATRKVQRSGLITAGVAGPLGLAWKIVKLPISVTRATLGLASGAFGLGLRVTGGVMSYSLGMIGLTTGRYRRSSSIPSTIDFVSDFESQYGERHPNFVSGGFTDALQRSKREFKLLFVYLHSPEHPDTPDFCKGTLCSEVLPAFLNENFIVWGDIIGASEGLKMSKSLKANRFPFCAVVMSASGQRVSLLRQFEGPRTPEEMLKELQRILEENTLIFYAEERRKNTPLREQEDADYRATLEDDQECQRRKDQNQQEREKEIEVALAESCKEKALSLGPEPEKGPNVTQVLVRLPNGERIGRRFDCSATLQLLYDFVDSFDCLEVGSYTLVTFFPRVLYGQDKMSSTLEELGLHAQASLFVELNS